MPIVLKFKCPHCLSIRSEKVEQCMCETITPTLIKSIDGDIVEVPPHFPPGMPHVLPTESKVVYRCAQCRAAINEENHKEFFSESDNQFKTLHI